MEIELSLLRINLGLSARNCFDLSDECRVSDFIDPQFALQYDTTRV